MEEITLDHIIQYILGELPGEEMKRLRQLVQTDEDLSLRVEEAKNLLEGIKLSGEKEVEESVKSFHINFKSTPEFRALIDDSGVGNGETGGIKIFSLVTRYKWVSLAATILLLIVAGISIFKDPSSETLYANYYFPEQNFLSEQIEYLNRQGFANQNVIKSKILTEALELYKQKDYKTSNLALSNYLKEFPGDSIALLYLALTKLESKEYDAAAVLLKELIATEQGEIKGLANWYLALTLLKTDQRNEATRYLTNVANDNSNRYADKAKELLHKVNSE